MFHYTDDNKVIGILTDWDLSSTSQGTSCLRDPGEEEDVVAETEDADEQQDSETTSKTEARPRYRTGRGPFLALDLLSQENIAHQYRHDLESFFYVLCYFCAQFRSGDAENPQAYFAYLPKWEKGDINQLCHLKRECLLTLDSFKALFNETDPAFRPLINQWIIPLYRRIFVDVPNFTDKMRSGVTKLRLAQEYNDELESQRMMEKLQNITRKVNKTVNYEAFRKILSD